MLRETLDASPAAAGGAVGRWRVTAAPGVQLLGIDSRDLDTAAALAFPRRSEVDVQAAEG